jgi:hypothetical protein
MRMRMLLFALMMLAFVIVGNMQCTPGAEPEVVVVPVGEPGTNDPYSSNGDLSCGGSTSATAVQNKMVLVVFEGSNDIWLVYMPKEDFLAVFNLLSEQGDMSSFADITPTQVDELHNKFCGNLENLTPKELNIYQMVADALGPELDEITNEVCN